MTTPNNKVSFNNLNVVEEISIIGVPGLEFPNDTNIYIGSQNPTITGNNNINIGINSGVSITSGNSNIGIGQLANSTTITGGCNIVLGFNSGNGITTGDQNVGIGCNALGAVGGSITDNVAIGADSLRTVNDNNNVAIGYKSGETMTSQSGTTIIGHRALSQSQSGDTTAIGFDAARFQSGDENIAIGHLAMETPNTGSSNRNIAIGTRAYQTPGGNDNVVIGQDSLVTGDTSTTERNTILGNNSTNNPGVDTLNGAVVIGHDSIPNWNTGALRLICVGNSSLTTSGFNGADTLIIGHNSGNTVRDLVDMTMIGNNAGGNVNNLASTPGRVMLIGTGADIAPLTAVDNSITLGVGVGAEQDNSFALPSYISAIRMRGLGIHAAITDVTFDVTAGITNGVIKAQASAAKYKSNIQDINTLIDTSQVYNLQPRTFTFTAPNEDPQHNKFGIVADEADQHIPQLTIRDANNEISGFDYTMLTVVMLNEMKKEKPNWDRTNKYFVAEIDLTVSESTNIVIPDDVEFYPESINVIQTVPGTENAKIRFGDITDDSKYGTIDCGNNPAKFRSIVFVSNSSHPNSNILKISVDAADAGACKVYFRGIINNK